MRILPDACSRAELAHPMRIAYLDCFSGISGDMFLGALLDAGVPFSLFEQTVAELNVGATLQLSRVDRGGISATKLDVIVNGEKDLPREEFWAKKHSADHEERHEHRRRGAADPSASAAKTAAPAGMTKVKASTGLR